MERIAAQCIAIRPAVPPRRCVFEGQAMKKFVMMIFYVTYLDEEFVPVTAVMKSCL